MQNQNNRRAFFKRLAVVAAGASVASSGFAFKEEESVKKPHFGMIFDQNKCVGCTDCEIACREVNLVPKGQMRLFVQDKTDPKNLLDKRYVRVSCQLAKDKQRSASPTLLHAKMSQ